VSEDPTFSVSIDDDEGKAIVRPNGQIDLASWDQWAAAVDVAIATAHQTIRASDDVHVSPTAGGWEVRLQYELCATSHHDTRRSAVQEGRLLVSDSHSTLFIHGIDGSTVIEHAGTRAMSE
jgi:hypothetical protein